MAHRYSARELYALDFDDLKLVAITLGVYFKDSISQSDLVVRILRAQDSGGRPDPGE